MKLFKISIAFILMLCCLLYSCVDSDYHWDNINTGGVVQIPPIPLGSYDTIKVKDLGIKIPEAGGLPSVTVEHLYTLNDVFGSNAVKRFFHPYMTHNLSIDGTLDIEILGVGSVIADGLKIAIDFEVLDSNRKKIEGVEIKGLAEEDIEQGKQDLSIVILKEDRDLMQKAQHLLMKIKLRNQGTVTLRDKDYILLSNLIIKTGGYYVDL